MSRSIISTRSYRLIVFLSVPIFELKAGSVEAYVVLRLLSGRDAGRYDGGLLVMVYVITDGSGHIKIGAAKNVEERMRQLQTGNPRELKIIRTFDVDNDLKAESMLHEHFREYKVQEPIWTHFTEWFSADILPEIMNINDDELFALKPKDNRTASQRYLCKITDTAIHELSDDALLTHFHYPTKLSKQVLIKRLRQYESFHLSPYGVRRLIEKYVGSESEFEKFQEELFQERQQKYMKRGSNY